MIALGIIAAILLIIGFTRIRVMLCYDENGFSSALRVGLIRIKLYPRPKKAEKQKEIKKKALKKPKKEKKKKVSLKKGSGMIGAAAGSIKRTLRRLSRLMRFDLIELRFISACEGDPASTAIGYGKLNGIVYSAYPVLKNALRIKKTSFNISLNYEMPKSAYYGKLRLSISVGRIFTFCMLTLFEGLGFFIKYVRLTESEEKENGKQQAQAG